MSFQGCLCQNGTALSASQAAFSSTVGRIYPSCGVQTSTLLQRPSSPWRSLSVRSDGGRGGGVSWNEAVSCIHCRFIHTHPKRYSRWYSSSFELLLKPEIVQYTRIRDASSVSFHFLAAFKQEWALLSSPKCLWRKLQLNLSVISAQAVVQDVSALQAGISC